MRLRLHKPHVGGGHAEIRAMFGATCKTPPPRLDQGAIARRCHLRVLDAFWRRHSRSGIRGGKKTRTFFGIERGRTMISQFLKRTFYWRKTRARRPDPELFSQERFNPLLWIVFHAVAVWSVASYWLRFKRICAWHEPRPCRMGGNPFARRSTHGLCPDCFARVSGEIISHGETGPRVCVAQGWQSVRPSLPAPPARKCAVPARLQRPSAGDTDTARPAILRGKTI